MRVRPNSDGTFDVVEGQTIYVRRLLTEQAAYAWIDDNAGNWPPNWRDQKRHKR